MGFLQVVCRRRDFGRKRGVCVMADAGHSTPAAAAENGRDGGLHRPVANKK
jgi:hypothetical protein